MANRAGSDVADCADHRNELVVVNSQRDPDRPGSGIILSFGFSALASIGLTIVYIAGGQVQLEGLLLAIALGGLAAGLILWAKQMMPGGHYVQERQVTLGLPEEQEETAEALEQAIERRSFLIKMLGAALTALGIAALFPIRSLGSKPGRALYQTEWEAGARLVTLDNAPVSINDLEIGGVLTVFPEGFTRSADSQTLLIRIHEDLYAPLSGREDWAPLGFVAFSKVCTHAGCPVGLYTPSNHQLFCPCHQSVFDVLRAALPTEGPATRRLPQLPLDVDGEGFLVAQSDYLEPIGPGFWSRPSA
jgi:ubiquinol-cytochrome c reductase iron-sulfur subunit